MTILRRLRPDVDRGYEWWTLEWFRDAPSGEWTLKLGPVTLFDHAGFAGVAVLNRWCWERRR